MTAVPPELMSAAIYQGDGRIEVGRVPVPEPAPGELLVEVAECGICGSDLHMVYSQYARPGSILGHEWSGTVAAGNEAGPESSSPRPRAVEPVGRAAGAVPRSAATGPPLTCGTCAAPSPATPRWAR